MKTPPPFNIAALIRSKISGTYGKIESTESRAIADEIERYGLPDSGMTPIPGHALRATPLTVLDGNGGYLDQTNLQGYLPALQAQTNLLQLGATQVLLDKNATVTPLPLTACTPTWLTNDRTATTVVL